MSRSLFGASLGDYAIDASGRPAAGATFTVWDSITGGVQITDLLDGLGNVTAAGAADTRGFVRLYGPDGWTADLYAEDINGTRYVLHPVDLNNRVVAYTAAALLALALTPEVLAVGNLTVDGSGAVIGATLAWPDGATGTYTADATSGGSVDAYHLTHVAGTVTTTYTQPAVTRNGAGVVTSRPAMVVS